MMLTSVGCGTNVPTKAAQNEQIVITTVNSAVPLFVKAINAGKLTQSQCDKFKSLYQDYYNAQQVIKAVIEKANTAGSATSAQDITDANNAVVGAENALISFANSVLN